MVQRKLRIALFAVLALASTSIVSYAVYKFVLPIVAWFVPGLESLFYDLGVYGAYRTRSYVSYNLSSPQTDRLIWDNQCDNGYVLLSPHGDSVVNPGPMVLDGTGNLVWMSADYGMIMNLAAQEYNGTNFLTFWAGHKEGTFGAGVYYMLDSTYKPIHTVSAVGEGLKADLHEFKITKDGTALITVYNVTNADLTAMGRPADGWINDSLFQEIDIASGELLFEWKASEHFYANDSFMTHPLAGYWQSIPFDFFHINSIEKDTKGNYIISSRHMHTVTCISPLGETLWVLGGRYNEFKDLSGGAATDFKWNHDAKWVSEEEGILTIFDNSEAGILHIDAPYSTARMIKLDVPNRTATLLGSYISAQQLRAPSQGSVQVLPESRNIFVGWGHSPAYSEYAPDGTLICETHFGASWYDFFGRVVSYRAQKSFDWVGKPEYPPAVKIADSQLYVSWNGATEVATWELQGAKEPDGEYQSLDVVEKTGFESTFILPSGADSYIYYRVAALDHEGKVLNHSEVTTKEKSSWSILSIVFLFGILVSLLAGARFLYKLRINGGKGLNLRWRKYSYRPL